MVVITAQPDAPWLVKAIQPVQVPFLVLSPCHEVGPLFVSQHCETARESRRPGRAGPLGCDVYSKSCVLSAPSHPGRAPSSLDLSQMHRIRKWVLLFSPPHPKRVPGEPVLTYVSDERQTQIQQAYWPSQVSLESSISHMCSQRRGHPWFP